jgi:hypothetical protein
MIWTILIIVLAMLTLGGLLRALQAHSMRKLQRDLFESEKSRLERDMKMIDDQMAEMKLRHLSKTHQAVVLENEKQQLLQ